MLLSETIFIIPKAKAITYYKNKGYFFKPGEEIEVKVEDLPPGTHREVEVECDYCHNIYKKKYYHYVQDKEKYGKDCCSSCAPKRREEIYGVTSPMCLKESQDKAKETNLKKYGVDNAMKLKETQEKVQKTNLERYGYATVGENPEFRKKQEETMIKKYGVKNVFCAGELRDKSYQKTLVTKYKNKTFPASKNQQYLNDLYRGELNVLLCDHYFVDIFFKDSNIYCEYDGSGHNLNVLLGQITQEDFDKREFQRYHILKRNGYKVFKIINSDKNEKLPNDNVLLEIKRIAFEFLNKEDNFWINFDLNNKIIKFKNGEVDWNNRMLEEI